MDTSDSSSDDENIIVNKKLLAKVRSFSIIFQFNSFLILYGYRNQRKMKNLHQPKQKILKKCRLKIKIKKYRIRNQ